MPLMFSVLFTHAAHERPRLASVLQADKLDGVHLVLRAEHLLVGLVCQGHAAVLGQRTGGVGELRALGTQVRGAHRAIHGRRVTLIFIAADYALLEIKRQHEEQLEHSFTVGKNKGTLTSPISRRASSDMPD